MKVKVEVTKKEQSTIDVEFPLFLKSGDTFDNGHDYDSYYKIDEDGTEYYITVRDHGRHNAAEWEFKQCKHSDLGKYLGSVLCGSSFGQYDRITADVFYQKVAEFRSLLDDLRQLEESDTRALLVG